MRASGIMWMLFHLLLCGAVTSSTLNPTEATETTEISPKWPVVFGFEFTMTGIVTSAGLPNGTTVAVGATPGSPAYRAEMTRLYSICEEVARTSLLPAVAQDYRAAGAPFRFKVPNPPPWKDSSATQLRDAVVAAKHAALRTLSENFGLGNLVINTTFHALATAPEFIFSALKPVTVRHPLALWELRTFEHEVYPDIPSQWLAKAWLYAMVTQFSEAVVDAGFHRCSLPWGTMSRDGPYYDDFDFIYPTATHAICAAEIGDCSLRYGSDQDFHEYALTPCSYPGNVVVVANLRDTALSLWAEGINKCYLNSVPWNTWPELKPPPPNDALAWSEAVHQKISKLLRDTAGKSNTDEGVKLIPTGEAWTPALLDIVRSISTTIGVHETPQPRFAASMNAATVARYEERVLAERPDDVQHRYDINTREFRRGLRFGWSFGDKLWTVGGDCLNDQECEHACKWRGSPVCHPVDHVCMCAELYEDPAGGKREDLYRSIWKTEQNLRRKVVQRLLGTSEDWRWSCYREGRPTSELMEYCHGNCW